MKKFKDQRFTERLSRAATARQANLERFRSRPAEDDPVVVAQRAARTATAVAREARIAKSRAAELAEAEELTALESTERELRAAREALELRSPSAKPPWRPSARRLGMTATQLARHA